jgi:hypothetical protein
MAANQEIRCCGGGGGGHDCGKGIWELRIRYRDTPYKEPIIFFFLSIFPLVFPSLIFVGCVILNF